MSNEQKIITKIKESIFDPLQSEILKEELREENQYIILPRSIFTKKTSTFESICKYLKEDQNLTYTEIAHLLKREYKTISVTYTNAKHKHPKRFTKTKDIVLTPASIYKQDSTILSTIIKFLKDENVLTYKQIADILHRDQRTIWTIYNRK